MSAPSYPMEIYQPTEEQKEKYLDALRQGHSEELAVLMSGMTPRQAKDAVVVIGEQEVQRARLMAQLPLATVRERMNDLMLNAKDEEQPMTLRDALELLARRDPSWSTKAQLNVTMPTPILDVDAVKRASIEAVATDKAVELIAESTGD